METSEFSFARGIDYETTFKWLVPYTLCRRDRIIAGVNKRISRTTHKCGVEVPTSVAHAKNLDEKDGNALWMGTINRELENLKVTFDVLEDKAKILVGYDEVAGQLVFDIRMTLGWKSRWIKDANRTPEPEWFTFSGSVSRESVRVALARANLRDLPIYTCNIQNA